LFNRLQKPRNFLDILEYNYFREQQSIAAQRLIKEQMEATQTKQTEEQQ